MTMGCFLCVLSFLDVQETMDFENLKTKISYIIEIFWGGYQFFIDIYDTMELDIYDTMELENLN